MKYENKNDFIEHKQYKSSRETLLDIVFSLTNNKRLYNPVDICKKLKKPYALFSS